MQAALTPVARAGRAPNNPVSFLHTVKAPVFISRLPGNRDANSNKFTDHFLLGLHWPHLSLFLDSSFFHFISSKDAARTNAALDRDKSATGVSVARYVSQGIGLLVTLLCPNGCRMDCTT